jgi:singapore isolate B (sub-type 7) whole genome shotgun sequence assembly, scaffold_17
VGTVTISKNVKARKDEIFMPVTLPQGTIKEVHKAAGFEENGSCIVCWDSQLGRKR